MFDLRRFEFRAIRQEEGEEAAKLEQLCFPPNEACKREAMLERIHVAADHFLVAYDKVNHTIAGFLNGIATDEEAFRDEFFTDAGLHRPEGKSVMLLGLDVRQEYRHQGLATAIMDHYMERAREQGHERLVLTCLPKLVEFYEELGFTDLGDSASEWGGERWHEMEYIL